jgi:transcription initiation factor TFIIIB Brf1 subunit/transcription initiation factor TFIIB
MLISNCPNCNDENIEISYNPITKRHTLTCYNCNKYYKIAEQEIHIECPECQGKDIRYEKLEIICRKCGLVLSSVPPSYVADLKVKFDWGLIL